MKIIFKYYFINLKFKKSKFEYIFIKIMKFIKFKFEKL